MRKIGVFAVAIVLSSILAAVAIVRGQGEEAAVPREGVFIHLSHGADDPHRLLMALRMATVMAESGRGVLIYCDVEAVKLLARDAPDVAMEPFPSARTQLARLGELGARVRACPTCLKVAGIDAAQLQEGVSLADREEFFRFVPGRILSLDY